MQQKQPQPQELLGYLKRKPEGFTTELIPEATVYEVEPWQLPDAHASNGVDGNLKLLYFTEIKKKFRVGLRVDRQTGQGKWNPKYTEDIENPPGTVIGYKTYLIYQNRATSSSSKIKWTDTCWRMLEYRLPSGQDSSAEKEWVLCKIAKSTRGYDPQQNYDGSGDGDIGSAEGHNNGWNWDCDNTPVSPSSENPFLALQPPRQHEYQLWSPGPEWSRSLNGNYH